MKRRGVLLLILFVLSAVPAAADHESCESPLPFVLNLALPRLPKAYGFDAESLKRGVKRFMDDFYNEHGRCPQERPLQVNITVASEYEILDWLSQGLVQAAVIPDLTLYLLTARDGLDLRSLDLEDHPVGELLLPALSGRPRSGRLSGGKWSQGDVEADLTAFRQQLWRAAAGEAREKGPGYRIVLGSHLSTTGFLDPVLETAAWLEEKLKGQAAGEDLRERFWQAFFDHTRFAVDCDSLEPERPLAERSCWELPRAEEQAGAGPVEILYPSESALRVERGWAFAAPAYGDGDGDGSPENYREHLVIAGPETETIFDGGHAFHPAVPVRGAEMTQLFGDPKADTAPRAFLSILKPEPMFGVRSFSFTVDETLRLLRLDQATSERAELALVLPGGGVKAAYQSRIVDELYSRGYLKNFRVQDTRERKPLDVRYVIGTSGGALLGYFVSQLREDGPEGLTDILWKKDAKRGIYLRSSDVFGWTDLLRYASVIASFLILCVLLALLSIPERGPLNPAARPAFATWRLRLTLAVVPLLLLAPLLVRLSNRRSTATLEQVPEFEGL
ncbi:MAG TPA: patatin-like phospholipase family protein, partial [Thermoanaerobaculia bacterium]|nr:patatin-like phospholipase family protein [Thermoanaerobaculia bacterium]